MLPSIQACAGGERHARPSPARRPPGAIALGLAAILALPSIAATPVGGDVTEYRTKAAYLYRFVPFVRWPASSFQNAKSPISLCIAGNDPFGPMIDRAVEGRAVDGRRIEVRRIGNDPAASCHMLFLSDGEAESPNASVAGVPPRATLTVADHRGIPAVIQFDTVGGRVRFVINMAAAQASNLAISSKLLERAVAVQR